MDALKILDHFKEQGEFDFKRNDSLSIRCNAPRKNSGVYLVFAEEIAYENLIYIGISGRIDMNGEIIHRKDGLGGRLVNGKQFGKNRISSWPEKMTEDGIEKLIVKWYITCNSTNQVIPREIEKRLIANYIANFNQLPLWNKAL